MVELAGADSSGEVGVVRDADEAERELILRPARDYIECWLDGDADRMARCLHPDLVKRSVEDDPESGSRFVETMSRADLVAATEKGLGKRYERPYEATLLDVFEDIATVRVLSSVYLDYLNLAKFQEGWLLVNVLWKRRPGR
jgi:hypothetical protein